MFVKIQITNQTRTSPFSKGTTWENSVVQITESSRRIPFEDGVLKKNRQSLGLSAKNCQGDHVSPKSVDLSRAQTPGRGELAILMYT